MKKALVLAFLLIGCSKSGGVSNGPISSTDDYKTRGTALLDKMLDAMKETDCDKLAANISSFIDANKGAMDALKAWDKDHKDDKKAFEDANKDKMQTMMGSMMTTMEKCKDNKALKDALAKMPE